MSTTAAPFGMQPVIPSYYKGVSGVTPEAITSGIASAYGTAIYENSPVILNTSGNIVIGTTAADFYGSFAGVRYVPTGGGLQVQSNQWTAAATYVAGTMWTYVYSDPTLIYKMQSNGSLAQTAVGDQADFINPGTGSTTTGQSSAAISSSLAGAGVQAQLRIIGLFQGQDTGGNAWGDAFTIVLVQNARHEYVANKTAV